MDSNAGASRQGGLVNAVYYPSWGVYRHKPPSYIRVQDVTHVLYAFVGVRKTGSLQCIDEWADLHKPVDGQQGCLAALAELKRKNAHLKTLVSFGGANSSAEFAELAAGEISRQTFARQARVFCDDHGLDGIDVDWEHPNTSEQGRDFVKLIRAVREALPSPDYLVTAALPVGEYCLGNIDLAETCRMLDYLNLMAYDFTGAWTSVCGHHAQLVAASQHPDLAQSACRGVDYVLSRGVPAHKVVLGVPAYARFFPDAKGPGQTSGSNIGEMDYCDLPDEWVSGACVDDTLATASYVDHGQGGKGFVSFDVPSTVALKARYARATGLGGLFYWTGIGDRPGQESLIVAGRAVLES
ncbi:Glycoside hydrolase, subgroup, catalytic core [Metarhizium rileyi]|uniref:chitinase n=1 Tax=Metarhizium rileyi (strain RCEF 4871) TaxID=1649241 RepID=A0A167GNG2_METRR|nr:Glycoside hydrolase, subgroup, catalytic core [Metarhizium rileyi RCEF 4871]